MSTTELKSSKRRLLFFSLEDWNEVWRRNQFICAELARRNEDLELLWVGPPIDIAYSLLRRDFSEIFAAHIVPREVHGAKGIKKLRPLKLLPNKVGRKFNDRLITKTVTSSLRVLGWESFDIWINDQKAQNYLPFTGAQKLIYDITDDWSKLPQTETQRKTIIEDDTAMLEKADHVIVCSRQLYERKLGKCRALSLISNGVDNERYHPKELATHKAPPDIKNIAHPIAGYTGTLHSARLDLGLIAASAKELPNVHFVFVGPNCLTDAESALLRAPNIHILGSKPYSALPDYLNCFDICLTPHAINEFTESLDPLKLYEYMSTGKAIVSTKCAGFREYPDLIYLADTQDFSQAIETALQKDDQVKKQARITWASEQSWSSRVDQVEKVLGWRN